MNSYVRYLFHVQNDFNIQLMFSRYILYNDWLAIYSRTIIAINGYHTYYIFFLSIVLKLIKKENEKKCSTSFE